MVPEGQADHTFREIIESDSRWIQVDDRQWILRDRVLNVSLSSSDRIPISVGVFAPRAARG